MTPNHTPPPSGITPQMNESLRRFRQQTPTEALGLGADVSLFRSCVHAGLITLVLFAIFTAGPYFWGKSKPAPEAAPAAAPTPETPAPTPSTPPPGQVPNDPVAAKAPPTGPAPAGKADLLDKLGESGTKSANPKVNPLDRKDDDLLKDLDKK